MEKYIQDTAWYKKIRKRALRKMQEEFRDKIGRILIDCIGHNRSRKGRLKW